jgi:thymidylate synthase (FAD)
MKGQVLDHGYVEFIESWGTGKAGLIFDELTPVRRDCEVGIIEAARQSTQKGFIGWGAMPCNCRQSQVIDHGPRGVSVPVGKCEPTCDSVKHPGDAKLLKFLYDQHHDSPFEFAGMVIEVQAPIFVFREWHRHRTQSYNEMSARYTPLPDLYYLPSAEHINSRGTSARESNNRQARGLKEMHPSAAPLFHDHLNNFYRIAEAHYQDALADGIPKELARLVMPVGHYSRMRASANLRNWLAFMTLRCDPDAQWEIRQFAWTVSEFIGRTFPLTHALWMARQDNAL